MKRKIALKRLSSSDLTLFEYHYLESLKNGGTKQKAINLDAAVFISTFFPGLPSRLDAIRDRVIVTLAIYGPGGAGVHSITRKILKQQKNWRLNGELISNPPEEPGRYNSLEKDDFAILDFAGEPEPHTARIYFVGKASPQDTALHTALKAKYDHVFSPRKGMEEIDPEELAGLLNGLELPVGHPALDFIDFDALEDAAQGGLEGLTKLRKRRQARGVSREELGRAKQSAELLGRLGEEALNAWLETELKAGRGFNYRWESDTNAVAPYDFTLFDGKTVFRRIDAKSTAGDFRNPIHVSIAELGEMAHEDVPYDLYRLYSVNETTARLRIARDMGEFAAQILERFTALPAGITVDGISIKPEALPFGKEIVIDILVRDDDGQQADNPIES